MTSGYKFPILNSDGSASSTVVDFEDMFVSKDQFIEAGLYVWGLGQNGGLGLSDIINRSSPVQLGSLTNWSQVYAGISNSLAVKSDGTLWTWGQNNFGQLGLGNVNDRSSPVQVGSLANWKLVSSGSYYAAAIKTDGTLWMWGGNWFGNLGTSDIVHRSSPVQVGSLTNWKQVSPSKTTNEGGIRSAFTIATKADGTLWGWGHNTHGQLGLEDIIHRSSPVQVGSLTDWKQVTTGEYHTAAIKTDGTLWVWGKNQYGQLGLGNITNRSSPVQVGSLTNWKFVSAGTDYTAAIKTDGTLWTWGLNTGGSLGLSENFTVSKSSPIQVGLLTNWKQISTGYSYMAAIKTDGTLWAWGSGNSGQLGLGESGTIAKSSPIQVGSLTNWKSVVAAFWTTHAIASPDLP